MWCIPEVTPEFIERMENLLTLYAEPYDSSEPVLCFDEKSKQLLEDTRDMEQTKKGTPRRRDYEYKRNGVKNIFVTVEPKGGHREVTVTDRRTKGDFANEIKRIIDLPRYKEAQTIHLVCDNLNTHFEKSFLKTFGTDETKKIMDRLCFHYTPKHASWLNMAEIEIGILDRSYIGKRVGNEATLTEKTNCCMNERNAAQAMIHWGFTVKNARKKFKYRGSKLS